MDSFDVAVIGGGPAGSSAAITLAQRGHRVVLFEAQEYPHPKVCGEFLSPECAGLLDKLGAAGACIEQGRTFIDTAHLTASNGAAWTSRLPAPAWGFSRTRLDDLLAQRAAQIGVDLRPCSPVQKVSGSLEQGFRLTAGKPSYPRTETSARLVIAAYGKRSRLDHELRRPFLNQEAPFVALKTHASGPPLPNRIELHGFQGGYCGFSEIEGGLANICLLVQEQTLRQAATRGKDLIPSFLAWMQEQNPALACWLGQANPVFERWLSISQISFSKKEQIAQDILMAGDSAGLIAPLAGDGIGMALESGLLAAELCAEVLEDSRPAVSLRKAYPLAWKRRFTARLRLARQLQKVMFRPRALGYLLSFLDRFPGVGERLVYLTRN